MNTFHKENATSKPALLSENTLDTEKSPGALCSHPLWGGYPLSPFVTLSGCFAHFWTLRKWNKIICTWGGGLSSSSPRYLVRFIDAVVFLCNSFLTLPLLHSVAWIHELAIIQKHSVHFGLFQIVLLWTLQYMSFGLTCTHFYSPRDKTAGS